MTRTLAPALALALALVGSITLTHGPSTPGMTVDPVEVAFGVLASGSAVGANATNASFTLAGCTILACTTDLWYLNNTNATREYHAKLVSVAASGLAGITTLGLGIDNGTATDQIVVTAGALSQSEGAYVRLAPGSTNRVYATSLVGLAFGTGDLAFEAFVADDAGESAHYTMRGSLTVT